jgi:F-type H+-transporting ATPase subunit delta
MAELATIARPYAEALFKVATGQDAGALMAQLNALAAVTANADLRQFADNPKVEAAQVVDLVTRAAGGGLDARIANLLQAVIDNGRLIVLPEIAGQFQVLVNASTGVSDLTIQSAFAIDDHQLPAVVAALEKRFGRKLNAHVEIDPELIGGIRAVVGDEVLDTSVKSRLEQMKIALTA